MANFLVKIIKILIPNTSVLSIFLNRIWSVFKGPIVTLFQVLYLNPVQQGIWYTFVSLGAMSQLAELGFTNIITQFVSHESTYIKLDETGINGEKLYVDKVISLIRYAIKIFAIIIPILITILIIVGYFYFNQYDTYIYLAWCLYALSGGLNLFISLLQAIYAGFDRIVETQKNILFSNLVITIITIAMLLLGFNVFSLGVANLAGTIITLFLLFRLNPSLWKQIVYNKSEYKYNWFNEIIKLQGKYAISYISGYLSAQLFIPVMSANSDEVLSGQFGLAITMINTISNLSYAYIDSNIPQMNMDVERKEYNKFWTLSKKLIKKSCLIAFIGFLTLGIFILLTEYIPFFKGRILAIDYYVPLAIYQLSFFVLSSFAKCIRTFKEEPFVIVSVFLAIVTVLLLLFYNFLNLEGILIVISLTYILLVFPYSTSIYTKYKKKYK